jgi:regulator of RNase E activity RraA
MSSSSAPAALATDVSTASLSDALDSLGLPGSLHGIAALRQGQRAIGPVFTVTYEPVDGAGGTVGDFLDDVPAGAVILIDNDGRTDCTVWGGIMSETAHERRIAGTVINGTCRDVAVATTAGYPVWSVSRFMRTGKDRVRVAAVQTPIVIDGIAIDPGDILVADDDGAVVVPAHRWDEVRDVAERIDRIEQAIVEAVRGGATLAEARAQHGYHSLQTRKGPLMTDLARGHSTATLSEASGMSVALSPDLRSLWSGARLCGPAFTVQGAGGDNLALHHALLEAPAGAVLVADVGGARFGHWGEVLTVAAQQRGLTGLLIDGGVRDATELQELGFPVFSRNNSILGTRKDFPGVLQRPVTVGGITVHTGDLVVGDVDGVVALPAASVEGILDRADARVAHEAELMEKLRNGFSTLDLYDFGTADR